MKISEEKNQIILIKKLSLKATSRRIWIFAGLNGMIPSNFSFWMTKLNFISSIISSLKSKSDFIFYLWVDRDTSSIIRSLVVGDNVFKIGCFGKYTNCLFPLEIDTISIFNIWSLKSLINGPK